MAAIGVHFGYTCACVAVFKDGRADVVANDAGDRVTPAVVAYRDTEQIVGIAAKQGRIRNATNTVVKVKQILGRCYDDPDAQAHREESKCIVVNKSDLLRYEIDTGETTKYVSPEDVAKLIFHKMKETAQSALGSDVKDAVITVPFEFGEMQKNALRQAAECAGFNVLRLIHEPSAALLAYGIGQDSPLGKSHVLVYKLGGTSLSVTVLEVNSAMYRVLATQTDHRTGGESFTHELAQHFAAEFKKTFKQDVTGNPRAMLKLMNSADVAKHTLSTLGSANCFVDSLYDGMDFECNVSRARFELICSSLFNKSIQPIKGLLEQVNLSTSDINKVVLCGGSARIPKLQQMIRDLFPDVELLNSIPPDEVIPVGAAMQAGILVGKDSLSLGEDSITVDCCASDITAKEVDDSGAEVFTVLFPSGTPLPARRQHTLQGAGSLSSVSLELYQAQRPIAQIVLRDLEPKEELHDIVTVLTMKRDGSLHVTCTEQSSGRSEAITIETAAAAS
ncbi:heat shock 70 kDa protein 14-like [Sinocyclocheilus grahami]|uniref:Heat shock 70 kDa protein 14-like n=1 Tax=Sinocyclocheilus grahami TaxID=75366 RepID=A0A672RKE6_SINGR|nr:PREDICTED: heat shock 70 kDa protein 14-like [Sinocyclocheilus grahami]XP_016121935.1 PREDICTED: heat shock 70 kDa protein 14-like [Sinocyclocheilus grahami]